MNIIISLVLFYANKGVIMGNNISFNNRSSLIKSSNQFSIELYKTLRGHSNKNLIVSPYSIFYPLLILYKGACGKTEQEFASVLFLHKGIDEANLMKVRVFKDEKDLTLNSYNAFWLAKTIKLKKDYMSLLRKLNILTKPMDFQNKKASVKTINNWVSERTNNRIKQLVSEDMIRGDTRMILTNTIYFKAVWEKKFNNLITEKSLFYSIAGNKEKEMMHDVDYYLYTEINGVKILKRFFKGERVSILFFLPENKKDFNLMSVYKLFDSFSLEHIEQKLKIYKVRLTLPKFDFMRRFKVEDYLKKMGIHEAFLNQANFCDIADEPLKIDKVIHKAFITLNEEGCEAGAATAIEMLAGAAMPPPEEIKDFIMNHPFSFIIKDEETGLVLFIGEIKQ